MRIKSKGKSVWLKWVKFATLIGNVNMIVLLTLVYWIMVPLTALPFKLGPDRMQFKSPNGIGWTRRKEIHDMTTPLRNQGD